MADPILITGFEPFAGHVINPSAELLRFCPEHFHHWPLHTAVLPVSYREAPARLESLLAARRWTAVVMLGLAAGAVSWRIETVARNRNGGLVDNLGISMAASPVLPGRPAILSGSLPAQHLEKAIAARGIAASCSEDAGDYLCNHMFFRLMDWLAHHSPATLGGFVHLPPLVDGGVADADGLAAHIQGLQGLLEGLTAYLSEFREGVGEARQV